MASPIAVCFGGPSPEHDISVLTGLQVARVATKQGHDVVALYWSKTGTWHRADGDLEAADFVDGAPRSSEELELVAGPDGGFVERGRKRRPLPARLRGRVLSRRPRRGRRACRARFDLAELRYTGPSAAGAALGMDKLATNAVVRALGLPATPQALIDDPAAESLPTPLIVKPRWGGSSLGIEVTADLATALHGRRVVAAPARRRGRRAVPRRLERRERRGTLVSRARAVAHRAAVAQRRRDPLVRRQVPRGRGRPRGREPRAPGRHPRRRCRAAPRRRAPRHGRARACAASPGSTSCGTAPTA